jgi:general secretion pathway protein E
MTIAHAPSVAERTLARGALTPPPVVASDLAATAAALGIEYVPDLSGRTPVADFVPRVPIAYARRHLVLAISERQATPDDAVVVVVLGDIDAWQQVDVVGRFLDRPVVPALAPPAAVLAAINVAYQQQSGQAEVVIASIEGQAGAGDLADAVRSVSAAGREDLLDVAGRAPVIKLVNLLLLEAVRASASDVHVQPTEEKLVVRLRIDGVLYDSFSLPRAVQEEVIGRLKVLGRMDIAEKRLAQDGRATAQVGDRRVDLRIASLPTSHGERVVVRLLDKGARLYRLGELGMPAAVHGTFGRLVNQEHGLLLVTGPTGSGKSTTLYAALQEIDCAEHNVLTLEDPIEYQLEGVSQTQVSEKKGMTFASGLRHVLRQDPDVIMVGEIRDRETAAMAIQSALTGHMVFSTLHTNDAASAVARLLDLGVEPYLVSSSVVGVLAQRLVRKVCPHCGEDVEASDADRAWLGLERTDPVPRLRLGRGCGACRGTGYKGRIGLFELLVADEPVRRLVQSRATAAEVKASAVARGMRTLRDDGVTKVQAGLTTIHEIERVAMRSTGADDAHEPDVSERVVTGVA